MPRVVSIVGQSTALSRGEEYDYEEAMGRILGADESDKDSSRADRQKHMERKEARRLEREVVREKKRRRVDSGPTKVGPSTNEKYDESKMNSKSQPIVAARITTAGDAIFSEDIRPSIEGNRNTSQDGMSSQQVPKAVASQVEPGRYGGRPLPGGIGRRSGGLPSSRIGNRGPRKAGF